MWLVATNYPKYHGEVKTKQVGITIGAILIATCTTALVVGAVFLFAAHRMPAHADELRAQQLTWSYEENFLTWTDQQRKEVEQQITSLRTSKWTLCNAGLSLSLAGATLLTALILFRLWDVRNFWSATTPRTRFRLLALASCAWATLLPAIQLEIDREYAQDDLLPAVDTGHGMFLIFGPPIFFVIWMVMMAIGRFVILRTASMPANLWCWDGTEPYRSGIWSTVYALLSALLLVLIAWSAVASAWFLPSLLVGVYVLLSTRAVLLNRDRSLGSQATGLDRGSAQ